MCAHTDLLQVQQHQVRLKNVAFFADAVIWLCDSVISWLGASIRATAVSGLRNNHPIHKRIICIKVANWYLSTLICPLTVAFGVRGAYVGSLMLLSAFLFSLCFLQWAEKHPATRGMVSANYWLNLTIFFKSWVNRPPGITKLKIIWNVKSQVDETNWGTELWLLHSVTHWWSPSEFSGITVVSWRWVYFTFDIEYFALGCSAVPICLYDI